MSQKKQKHTINLMALSDLIIKADSLYAVMFSIKTSDILTLRRKSMHDALIAVKHAKKRNSSKRSGAQTDVRNIAYWFIGYPDAKQQEQLLANINGCRFLWNRMKADRDTLYKELGVTIYNTPADYKDIEGLEWLASLDSYALCNVQLNLEAAYADWLSGEKGRPHFKKKGLAKASYTTTKDSRSDNVSLSSGYLKLPKIKKPIRLKCHRPVMEGARLKSCTVTHEPDGRWMFTLLYEYDYDYAETSMSNGLECFLSSGDTSYIRHIGLDMSLPHMYVDSNGDKPFYINNGNIISFEKHYRLLEERIGREQRRLSKMVKHSSNYDKQCKKIASLHAKAKQQRHDFIEQMSSRLAKAYDVICIEDLDIASMKKSLKFGKSVSDNGWGEFVSALERKCEKYGHLLIRIDKWFPSSKTCINCGHIHSELKLSDRTYICPVCGHVMDRDIQAAQNIDANGMRIIMQYFKGNVAHNAT